MVQRHSLLALGARAREGLEGDQVRSCPWTHYWHGYSFPHCFCEKAWPGGTERQKQSHSWALIFCMMTWTAHPILVLLLVRLISPLREEARTPGQMVTFRSQLGRLPLHTKLSSQWQNPLDPFCDTILSPLLRSNLHAGNLQFNISTVNLSCQLGGIQTHNRNKLLGISGREPVDLG